MDTITTRVREVDGEIKTYPAMGLSLTYDHRAVDGAPASRFLKDLSMTSKTSVLLAKGNLLCSRSAARPPANNPAGRTKERIWFDDGTV